MPASLSSEDIARLTRKDDQKQGSGASRWITANDAKYIIEAIELHKGEVAIGGEMFTITAKTNGNYFIRPRQHAKYVPCGEYSLGLLMSLAA